MNILEYVQLKKRRLNAVGREKRKELGERLRIAEEESDEIKEYVDLNNRLARLRKIRSSWKRWDKDCSKINIQIEELEVKINEMLCIQNKQNTSEICPSECIVGTHQPQEIKPQLPVTQPLTPNYYIINLAWVKDISESLLDTVKSFLNMSNFISFDDKTAMMRREHLLQWKFAYDTVEEMAQAKSIYVCASHLLSVLNKNRDVQIELFCKIQNY